jgi:hypothetical protein
MHLKRFVISRSILATLALLAIGCSNIEKAKPQPQSVRPDTSFSIDVPEILRGTVASETIVLGYEPTNSRGYQPVIARGYGLVVGLNGTGSRDITPQVRAYMLAEAAKGGIGSPKYGEKIASISPEKLLDSPDTAVVIVEAVVPQGAVKGTRFDVRVYAEPNSGTTSLEGGTLWTTKLRPGPLRAGGAQAFELAVASGQIFVNPFAEPGAIGRDTVNRTAGRILNGGEVVKDMPLKLRLANPSHARAAMLQTSINTRFPQEPRQHDPTARGESDELIELNVPPSYAHRTEEFIELVRHTTISQANPEATALWVRRALQANPIVARAATLRWQALGTRCLPIIKDLYDHPEEAPRLAALHAGAKLDDPLVISHLIDMAQGGSADARVQAIQLLADMRLNPQIDLARRALLDDDDTEVRLQAYEALTKRADPAIEHVYVDRKFILDIVESKKPLIYITQVGQPRVVLFGRDLEIDRPATARAWSDRLMLKADDDERLIEVYYRPANADRGSILRTEPDLRSFIQFLGHKTSIDQPAPGLGLTYGETVGALYQIWMQKYIQADFKAEQDRILAAITRIRSQQTVPDRPDFTESDDQPADPFSHTAAASDLGRMETQPNQGVPIKNAERSGTP